MTKAVHGAELPAQPPERSSVEVSSASIFASSPKAPTHSLIVVVPANHAVALERVIERHASTGNGQGEVIVACAGQPANRAALHAQVRNPQFLLAPADTSAADLRVLAAAQASGDVLTFVDSVPVEAGEAPTALRAVWNPALSVVVPIRNSGPLVAETLGAIVDSALRRESFEIIAVDDSSHDGSAANAARYADILIRLRGGPRGAAYARNRGAEFARGDVLAFVDAGVRVRRDTLQRLLDILRNDAALTAVAASNDGSSGDGGVPTQYWNLLQQYGERAADGAAIHFSASCGVVRRQEFLDAGMFDEWRFRGATVEDLELGDRLHRRGLRVVLRPDISFTNLRPHGLVGVLRRGWQRSALLTRLLGYHRTRMLAPSHVVHALGSAKGLTGLIAAALAIAAALRPDPIVTAAAAVSIPAVLYANRGVLGFLVRRRGLTFAVAATPLHVAAQIAVALGGATGWILRHTVGEPGPDPTTQAFAEVGVRMWPPVPRRLNQV